MEEGGGMESGGMEGSRWMVRGGMWRKVDVWRVVGGWLEVACGGG